MTEDNRRGTPAKANAAVAKLQTALKELADVRAPGAAEEPILARPVREALFEWMTEIRCKDELAQVGLRARTTAVLHGPPGCGKTTLAHHLAGRLGIPLVIVGTEMILAKWLGESEERLARLFNALETTAVPCILFLDEIDALGGSRDKHSTGADNVRTSILTILLRRIEEYKGYCIGATNRPTDLDPALWRRFHMQIAVELPGYDERFAILRRYVAPFELEDDDLDILTELTSGASPALLRGVMESVKRSIVLAPRMNRDLSDPVALFRSIALSIQPPPEMDKPPFWASQEAAMALAGITWPPSRPQ